MRYFISAGEASGDLHASSLMAAIREKDPEAVFSFMGGDLMAEVAGSDPVVHYREMAYMGFIPVLLHLGTIRRAAKKLKAEMKSFRPDVVVVVDYASFHLRYILPEARSIGSDTVYYILPKAWAWKKKRIPKIKRLTDLALTILPFEQAFFDHYKLATTYVGNPLVDAIAHARIKPLQQTTGHNSKPIIAILPGSRRQELKANLPKMLKAAKRFPEYDVVIAGAPGLTQEDYTSYVDPDQQGVSVVFGNTYGLLHTAKAALVTSGTATLEAALIGCPQLVCYNMFGGRFVNLIFDRFFSVKYFSLVNLIADRAVVPELLAADFTVDRIYEELALILPDGQVRDLQLEGYRLVQERVGESRCSEKAAKEIILLLKRDE